MNAYFSRHQCFPLLLAALATLAMPSARAADFFVAPRGADTNPGTRKEDGRIQLTEVPVHSPAAKAGLQRNDLVQSIHGRKTRSLAEFQASLTSAGTGQLTVRLV
jgi:S1-C subfamily serine protease